MIPFFFLGLLNGTAGAALVRRFAGSIGLIDVPSERSSHSVPTPRGGGIGIIFAFALSGVLLRINPVLIIPCAAAGLVGFLEDFYALPPSFRLKIQIAVSAAAILAFSGLPASPAATALFLFWVLFVTGTANFYNFMDGIDGIAGLAGFAGFGLMAYYSIFYAGRADIGVLSIVLSAACLGFLPFNLPRARIFMGDAGSMFLGFTFAFFIFILSDNLETFVCLAMFLCTFYADATVTIAFRLSRNENLTKPHRNHLYQYLTNEMKLPHWNISASYAAAQLLFAALSLLAYGKGFVWQAAVSMIFGGAFILAYKRIRNKDPGPVRLFKGLKP